MKYRPYPAYKDSGVEWLGDIPAHWRVSSSTSGSPMIRSLRTSSWTGCSRASDQRLSVTAELAISPAIRHAQLVVIMIDGT